MVWVAANALKVFLKPFVNNILSALTPVCIVVIVSEASRAWLCSSSPRGEKNSQEDCWLAYYHPETRNRAKAEKLNIFLNYPNLNGQ